MATYADCRFSWIVTAAFVFMPAVLHAEESHVVPANAESPATEVRKKPERKLKIEHGVAQNPLDERASLRALSPEKCAWVDAKNKQIVLDGEICLTRGMLEMFACPKGTKEHESIVTVTTKAYVVHAALLAIGAKSGSSVKYYPEYVAATGATIDVSVFWNDENGNLKQASAQDWVRNINTHQAMAQSWVFGGSDFYVDETTKERHYLAEQGDFICVANFPTAMLDLPFASPQDNNELLFEAFTERIPTRGTKVKLVLSPKFPASQKGVATVGGKQ